MKSNVLILFLLFVTFVSHAQVSIITDKFSSNLTKNDLEFSGDRKLFAIGMDDKKTKNYIVVSKNKAGADNDELYIEKFTLQSEKNYNKTFFVKLTHPVNKSLAFVNNRMSYQDADKDGNAEFLYTIDQHSNGVDSPLEKLWGIAVYKNKAYKMWTLANDGFTKTYYDDSFKELPEVVKNYFIDFWNKLEKK